jgi:hypothetical protein
VSDYESHTVVLVDGPSVGKEADVAGFLVRQLVMEAGRLVAIGRFPGTSLFAVTVARTQLSIVLHVQGPSPEARSAELRMAEQVWREIAERALSVASP